MFGLMQDRPLMISSIITFAARNHALTEIVSKNVDGTIHRTNYAGLERRARQLVNVLQMLGIKHLLSWKRRLLKCKGKF